MSAYHGTRTSYNYGCRCQTCVEANDTHDKTTEHGTRFGYGQGCRCVECRRANTEYERIRSRSQQAQRVEKEVHTSDLAKSENAIERERQKRRVEKQIEIDLRYSEPRVQSRESVFASLGFFMRRPKPAGSGWGCPSKGCSSS